MGTSSVVDQTNKANNFEDFGTVFYLSAQKTVIIVGGIFEQLIMALGPRDALQHQPALDGGNSLIQAQAA